MKFHKKYSEILIFIFVQQFMNLEFKLVFCYTIIFEILFLLNTFILRIIYRKDTKARTTNSIIQLQTMLQFALNGFASS